MRPSAHAPSAFWLRLMPVILGILTAVGPVSTDIYLPAFPALEHSFGTAAGSAQITLAVWFIGLACGQITQGPFSDRFGRRLPLLLGGVLYTLASIGCALAHDLWSFTACRFIAALGASAAMVVPAATVRDVSEGAEAARKMSTLVLIMGVVPILAPAIGGVVLGFASWRVIFWAAAVYGVVCLALVWRVLPETLPHERRTALPPVALLARYLHIARDPQFSTNAVIGGFSAFVCFAYLGGAPGLFIRELHFSPTQFGVLFGMNAVAMIGASQVNGLLVRRVGVSRLLRFAVAGTMAASLLLLAASLAGRAH
ncbi:multidrug effflux MFS transporter, partial [Endobacter medicaginis]